jgi:hypothetical protein
MKYLKYFEDTDEYLPDNIKLVDVLWNGIYRTYNNELSQLSVGDYTDKGIIIKRSDSNSNLYYSTEQGEFRANQLKVYTSNNYWDLQDFINTKLAQNKYNL